MNGIQTLEKLRSMGRADKVLILTIHNEIEYLIRAIDIGVNGYVLKDSDSDVLKKAIFTVLMVKLILSHHLFQVNERKA